MSRTRARRGAPSAAIARRRSRFPPGPDASPGPADSSCSLARFLGDRAQQLLGLLLRDRSLLLHRADPVSRLVVHRSFPPFFRAQEPDRFLVADLPCFEPVQDLVCRAGAHRSPGVRRGPGRRRWADAREVELFLDRSHVPLDGGIAHPERRLHVPDPSLAVDEYAQEMKLVGRQRAELVHHEVALDLQAA